MIHQSLMLGLLQRAFFVEGLRKKLKLAQQDKRIATLEHQILILKEHIHTLEGGRLTGSQRLQREWDETIPKPPQEVIQ